MTFGKILKTLRNKWGWTQTKLAGEAKVSQVLVSRLETGDCQPGWATVQALAKALGVGVEAFT